MGTQLLKLAFLLVVVVSILASKKPLRTMLYVLGSMVLTFCLGLVIVVIDVLTRSTLSPRIVSARDFYISLLVGMLAALIHSRRTRA